MRDQVDQIFADRRVQQAFRYITDHESDIAADQIRLTEIPAPPFGEAARANRFGEDFANLGFRPATDSIGNVVVAYDGLARNPVVISAHLDTIFPSSCLLQLQRKGRVLFLPGISDNGAGIVALLWAFRAARETGIRFGRPVIGIGSVGEEGEGNLRGIRHVFSDPPWDGRECDFIAVDGAGFQRITHQALGSRRLRVRMTGPGGHSWADFGRPNPVHAMASVIHNFCATARTKPGTSFNFGVVRGGISVNAIPREATMEVDLRSVASVSLRDLESHLTRAIGETVRSSHVECRVEIMGDRPSGSTAVTIPLMEAAVEVTRRFGLEPQADIGSTDANIPISLGLPAIALGAGGSSGNVHTPDEWFDPLHREFGIQRLLALIAVLAELS